MRILLLLSICLVVACNPLSAKEKVLDIQEVTSPGGIKAWLVEDSSLPIISLRFSFKGAGAIRDGQEKQGIARLLSNTMDEGAGDLTSQEFQKMLSDYSISLSFNSGRDNFGGKIKTLSRNKEKAFELLTLALTQPRFDEEPVNRMRQANLSRIRSSMGNPDWISARLFNDIAFQGHPYALNSGGTLTTLQAITTDDLRQYVKDWLTKDRLMIGVTGDISAKELRTVLDRIFGQLPSSGKTKETKQHTIQNSGTNFFYEKDIPQTILSMALPSFDKNDPDYYALRVMNYIFGGGGFGSRLMEEAREKRGLTYGIYSGLIAQDYLDAFTVSTSTKNESAQEMINIIKQEMNKIISQEVSKAELQDAQSYITGSMPLSLTSTGAVSSILLGLQLDDRPIDYLDHFIDRINAVTTKDIQRVAERALNPEKMTTIMVGKPENFQNLKKIETIPNVE